MIGRVFGPCNQLTVLSEAHKTPAGNQLYFVQCSICAKDCELHEDAIFTISKSNICSGRVPCGCSVQAQKFSYIHVLKNNDKPLFLKYGITRCIYDRVSKQSRKTPLTLETLGVWEFSNSQDCKNAEKVVKNLVGKGVADKSEMPDGFTETCNLSLLEDIIKIYEEYGGMRVQW